MEQLNIETKEQIFTKNPGPLLFVLVSLLRQVIKTIKFSIQKHFQRIHIKSLASLELTNVVFRNDNPANLNEVDQKAYFVLFC